MVKSVVVTLIVVTISMTLGYAASTMFPGYSKTIFIMAGFVIGLFGSVQILLEEYKAKGKPNGKT